MWRDGEIWLVFTIAILDAIGPSFNHLLEYFPLWDFSPGKTERSEWKARLTQGQSLDVSDSENFRYSIHAGNDVDRYPER